MMKTTRNYSYGMAAFALIMGWPIFSAWAEEGMWTMDHLPLAELKKQYNFVPSAEWINRVTKASARLARGCSASFVSENGLVMTNHHCANECLQQLSTKQENYFTKGFSAESLSEEKQCPAMELDRLDKITDVTPQVKEATSGKKGREYTQSLNKIKSTLEKECVTGDPIQWRCDVVTLYHGGKFSLYRYKRYQDVRLVMAPDQNIAFFGGDEDNFNFPRYDLDVTFLRAYENGKPAKTEYLPFNANGPKAGDLVFTSGNPGHTSRQNLLSELLFSRNTLIPFVLDYYATLDGALWQYARQGQPQKEEAQEKIFLVQNSLKVYRNFLQTLNDPSFIARKQKEEATLQSWAQNNKTPDLDGDTLWAVMDRSLATEKNIIFPYLMFEKNLGFAGNLYQYANLIVRGKQERFKPDSERLVEWHEARIPEIKALLAAQAPVYKALEKMELALSLTKMRQVLGVDHKMVKVILKGKTPSELADQLVEGTHLEDPQYRLRLWEQGEKALSSSSDPMIALALKIEPYARSLRKEMDDQVMAPQQQVHQQLSGLIFAREGENIYPDATFTQRLSYGTVKGWKENGAEISPFTNFAGLYERAEERPPFELTAAWKAARSRLNLAVPFDFVSTNDIIGGNSGSPVIDREGQVVGLIFDGNLHSIGGDYYFDLQNNRAIAVDTAAIMQSLQKVYNTPKLVDELQKGKR
ncbi:S46 family peptidase [Entomobacter blattae]|uniref:Dipeptidyl-peptidase n=1 Tax=Entomobacter blattae TaxID=2762277 RepID=A0A7H1NUC6_9PROT|nr:S46 family peptidase [Entomobacter blattae]QNT79386.1 Dipeptidyl aminopeptidase BII [Entomobacter blattae]